MSDFFLLGCNVVVNGFVYDFLGVVRAASNGRSVSTKGNSESPGNLCAKSTTIRINLQTLGFPYGLVDVTYGFVDRILALALHRLHVQGFALLFFSHGLLVRRLGFCFLHAQVNALLDNLLALLVERLVPLDNLLGHCEALLH